MAQTDGKVFEGPIATWNPSQVVAWLTSLHLPEEVAQRFQFNAVTGADLVSLSDADLTAHLALTPLQARKIRSALTELGVAAPAEQDASREPAPPPAAATPAEPPLSARAPQPAYVAAAAAAPAQPDPRTSFLPADLQRYNQLQQSIAELQALQIPAKLTTAQQFANGVQQQLAAAEGALPVTRAALAKEEKAATKHASGGGCLGLCSGRAERKQAEAEAQASRLREQLQQQEQRVAALAAQAQEARSQLSAWQAKSAELAAARLELGQLVERMFAAPAWRASPQLNSLGDSLRALEGQAAEAGRNAASYARGVQLLQGAARGLQEAVQALGRTQMMGAVNMGRGMGFQRRTGENARRMPGRQFGNLAEMAVFRRANEGVAKAARDAAEASALLGPGMPRVDPAILRSARAGMFQNILIGGTISDAIQLAAVRRSLEQAKVLLAQVQAALSWAQSNLGAHQQQEAALRAQAASKQAEVDAFRAQALQQAAAAAV